MALIHAAHRFAAAAPREALMDALGLAALCGMIFAGFTVPALL